MEAHCSSSSHHSPLLFSLLLHGGALGVFSIYAQTNFLFTVSCELDPPTPHRFVFRAMQLNVRFFSGGKKWEQNRNDK